MLSAIGKSYPDLVINENIIDGFSGLDPVMARKQVRLAGQLSPDPHHRTAQSD
jgi:hypothetical protein